MGNFLRPKFLVGVVLAVLVRSRYLEKLALFCFVKDLTTRLQTSRVTFMQLVKQLTRVFYS